MEEDTFVFLYKFGRKTRIVAQGREEVGVSFTHKKTTTTKNKKKEPGRGRRQRLSTRARLTRVI